MYKKILIVSILLVIGIASLIIRERGNQPELAGILREVPMYYYDKNDMETFFIDSKGIEHPISEYDGHDLKVYEAIASRPKKKIRVLGENEYYKTGNTGFGSSTAEVIIKQSGIESIKYEKDLLLQ